jgi:hypothetical protein
LVRQKYLLHPPYPSTKKEEYKSRRKRQVFSLHREAWGSESRTKNFWQDMQIPITAQSASPLSSHPFILLRLHERQKNKIAFGLTSDILAKTTALVVAFHA